MKSLLACFILGIHGSLAQSLLDPECVKTPIGIHNQIIGGQDADILSYPWMVQILQRGYHFCGGSLITSHFILTAAHCRSHSRLKVRLGGHDGTTPRYDCSNDYCSPLSAEIDVAVIYMHPKYQEYHHYDIAVFQLAAPVKFNAQIRPICVLTSNENIQRRALSYVTMFNATGWGETETGFGSLRLQSTSLYNLDLRYCSNIFHRSFSWAHICAGHAYSSTCTGDSGGPLSAELTFSGVKRPYLFGLTSYGVPNCRDATAFTNVLEYTDWIRYIVNEYTPKMD